MYVVKKPLANEVTPLVSVSDKQSVASSLEILSLDTTNKNLTIKVTGPYRLLLDVQRC